jgi:hypothetical protein
MECELCSHITSRLKVAVMRKYQLENQHALATLRKDDSQIVHDLANAVMRTTGEWRECVREYREHRSAAHGI